MVLYYKNECKLSSPTFLQAFIIKTILLISFHDYFTVFMSVCSQVISYYQFKNNFPTTRLDMFNTVTD